MKIELQLAEYCDHQDELHPAITPDEVTGPPVRVSTPVRRSPGAWRAGVAAAIVVLVIGSVGLYASQRAADEPTDQPTTVTTLVEGSGELAVAESFAQARSDGDAESVLVLLADDAVVSMGPASSKGEIAMEMRWQEATGLAFSFDRCESQDGSAGDAKARFSCFVSWTGAVAASLGHGTDSFEYSVEVADNKIVSAVLVDLGEYSATTWRPFLTWMQENHDSEIAAMYTPEWHAVLTDESIELWTLRTAEFVAPPVTDMVSLGSPVDVVPIVMTFGEDLSVTWIQLVPGSVGEPFGVFETPDGGLAAVGVDEHLAELTFLYSADGWQWTQYPTHDAFFSEHPEPWSRSEWAAVWTDYESPPDGSVAELSNGYLISDMEVSTDGGATWFAIPDHPNDDGPGGFSVHGTAGDLVYYSNDDGLWIGYVS